MDSRGDDRVLLTAGAVPLTLSPGDSLVEAPDVQSLRHGGVARGKVRGSSTRVIFNIALKLTV